MYRALVTGGTKGIGQAIASAILGAGGHVMITGRDRSRVDAAVHALGHEAGDERRVAGCVADMRDRAAVERAVAETVKRFGAIDTLINNAGVGVFKDVAAMSDEEWDRVIGTNLTGVFYCCRAVVPEMKRAGGGWIINIASLAGRNYFATAGAYCASKAGLVALSESLMLEVRDQGIRVSVVMPGSVATDFSHPREHTDDSWKLKPADVAEVVIDLLRHPSRSLPSKVEIRPSKTK
ncbi:MAG TPA: SDR family oxidoreductase [Vicinamibacterales bacterium]|nr:SDR family oxidoreductase [Vicinamibacterales bacterium]